MPALLLLLIPIAGTAVKLIVDAVSHKIPRKLRAPAAMLGGAAVGAGAAALGVPVDQAIAIAGATGAAAQLAHAAGGAVTQARAKRRARGIPPNPYK